MSMTSIRRIAAVVCFAAVGFGSAIAPANAAPAAYHPMASLPEECFATTTTLPPITTTFPTFFISIPDAPTTVPVDPTPLFDEDPKAFDPCATTTTTTVAPTTSTPVTIQTIPSTTVATTSTSTTTTAAPVAVAGVVVAKQATTLAATGANLVGLLAASTALIVVGTLISTSVRARRK